MMDDGQLANADILTLKKEFASGESTPQSVTEKLLSQINGSNIKQQAFSTVADTLAREIAAKGPTEGRLSGIPIAVSDSLHVAGLPAAMGSLLLDENLDDQDSPEVARIRAAGAVIMGKTSVPEFDLGHELDSRQGDHCTNPWDSSCSSGGSGTAVAVARGWAAAGIGSDLWGNIRISAGLCGLVGLKPTRGLIDNQVRLPHGLRQLSQRGVLARSAADVGEVLNTIYTRPPAESSTNLRVGFSLDLGFLDVETEVVEALKDTVSRLEADGHTVENIDLGWNHDAGTHFRHIVAADIYGPIIALKRSAGSLSALLTPSTKQWLIQGDKVTGVQYSMALTFAHKMKVELDRLFKKYDVILVPTQARLRLSPNDNGIDSLLQAAAATLPMNLSGHPALSIPCGWSTAGTPIGAQLIGPYDSENHLLEIAKAIPWES
jgi:Asp-tRNA(Asn)/Glu-tRNA(Gln) amidotransferase A subunit family amidase